MRSRHPIRLIARLACSFVEVFPVDYETLDAYIDELAALSDLADPAVAHAHRFSDSPLSPAGLQGFEDQGVSFLA
jgi:hypothetical protein